MVGTCWATGIIQTRTASAGDPTQALVEILTKRIQVLVAALNQGLQVDKRYEK